MHHHFQKHSLDSRWSKMKISLVLIATLAIGFSSQQHYPYQYYGRNSFQAPPYLGWNYFSNFMLPNRFQYDERQLFNGPQYAVEDNWNTVVHIPNEKKQNEEESWPDVQPKAKWGNRNRVKPQQQPQHNYDEDFEGRNYYNQAHVANSYNPLLKTVYFFTSTTATTCVVSRCIPAAQFLDVTAQNSICHRKKRQLVRFLDSLLDDGEEAGMLNEPITPATTEKIMQTIEPSDGFINELASLPPSVQSQVQLMSSKDEKSLADVPRVKTSSRTRRFLKNLFAVSTTVTLYSFTTSTYTSKLRLAEDAMITCRPPDVGIC